MSCALHAQRGKSAHISRYCTQMKNRISLVIQNSEGHRDKDGKFQLRIVTSSESPELIRDLNSSWHVSLVSSHTLAEMLLSCQGQRFHKFIPQEFFPFVRDTVLCLQFIACTDCCKAAVAAATNIWIYLGWR